MQVAKNKQVVIIVLVVSFRQHQNHQKVSKVHDSPSQWVVNKDRAR